MSESSISFTIEGPRWARIDKIIKDACFMLDLKCNLKREVFLLREKVSFKISGPGNVLIALNHEIKNKIKAKNAIAEIEID